MIMIDTGRIPLTGEALNWYRQGLACAAKGELEKAVALYNQVIHTRPDFWEAWFERGLALSELGLYGEAIASYDRALSKEQDPEATLDIWYHRANALQYGLGDYEAAINSYDYVLRVRPQYSAAWYDRGNLLLYGLNQPDRALESYDKALRLKPQNALNWRNRGNALMEMKHFTDALHSYDRALLLDPTDQIAMQARMLAAQQLGLRELREPTTRASWYGVDETVIDEAGLGRDTRLPAFELPVLTLQPTFVVEDESGVREIALEEMQYTIGRDPRNGICLRSQFASRYHAVLHRVDLEPGQYTYRIQDGDVGNRPSTNGIQINGQKQPTWALSHGDVITFGPKTRATYRMPLR
jgi:tetratricopeptide (TPR) repeat protein